MDRRNLGIETEKEKKTRTGSVTGTVTEIKEETETGTGIATMGITVKEGNTEIVPMVMIVTEAVILKGEENVKEMGIALAHGLVQGAGIADLGLVLIQKASVLVDSTWHHHRKLWLLHFLLFQPPTLTLHRGRRGAGRDCAAAAAHGPFPTRFPHAASLHGALTEERWTRRSFSRQGNPRHSSEKQRSEISSSA